MPVRKYRSMDEVPSNLVMRMGDRLLGCGRRSRCRHLRCSWAEVVGDLACTSAVRWRKLRHGTSVGALAS